MDKILIVDDMQTNLILMSSYLQNSGYEVFSASNGQAAIKNARLLKPALIILDVVMPGMSGYDVCRVLKSDPETQDIQVLVSTASDSKESRTRAFEVGADDFVTKPFDKAILKAKVKSLLRISHLKDKLKVQYEAINEQNRQIDTQLKMAKQIQQALISKYNNEVKGVEVTFRYMPAIDIGGDIYEVVALEDGRLCIFMADVSGHGISAALLTSMIKIMFKNNLSNYIVPNVLLEKINREFYAIFSSSDINVYACALCAIINTEKRSIVYSNAGQALPIFIDHSEGTIDELSLGGVPLGMMEDTLYDIDKINYESNDVILFYTDGLQDSLYKNSPDEFIANIKELIQCMPSNISSKEFLDDIINQFYNDDEDAKFKNDDVTIILCRFK